MKGAVTKMGLWMRWVVYSLVAALGLAIIWVGSLERAVQLICGGTLFLLFAVSCMLWDRAMQPGPDGGAPSLGEKAAWSQLAMGLALMMGLCGMAAVPPSAGLFAHWLFFVTYALSIVAFPAFRRRFGREGLRRREVAEDERDRAILAQGERLSRRLLECMLVVLALVWLAFPGFIHDLGNPLQIAAVLFTPVFAANGAGEARIAWLYWRDRR